MEKVRTKLNVVQNMGLMDRMVRVSIGTALIAGGIVSMHNNVMLTWEPYAILISCYPLLTCILGWDPVYEMFEARTCSLEAGRNECGTLPFEIDAALGHKPLPDRDFDHSLYGAHHEPQHGKAA
jgi:hypothetical protein